MLDIMTLHAVSVFYEPVLDLLQGIKTNMLTSVLIYVYDISTVMSPGALKSVTMLRTAITEFFTMW